MTQPTSLLHKLLRALLEAIAAGDRDGAEAACSELGKWIGGADFHARGDDAVAACRDAFARPGDGFPFKRAARPPGAVVLPHR